MSESPIAADEDDARSSLWPKLRHQLLPVDAKGIVIDGSRESVVSFGARLSQSASGSYGLVVLPIMGKSATARLLRWAAVITWIRTARRVAKRMSLDVEAEVGFFPDLDHPIVAFETAGRARSYAEDELFLGPVRGVVPMFRTMMARLSGVSPALGGIVIVLRKA